MCTELKILGQNKGDAFSIRLRSGELPSHHHSLSVILLTCISVINCQIQLFIAVSTAQPISEWKMKPYACAASHISQAAASSVMFLDSSVLLHEISCLDL